ncbi:transglutaminase family protein [Hirschia baltica]|uniref:Transglutaminase domain protein n=1 Tax=Hirschia baltica (strain ATCC 49814 / DSM 5838 / IFAM 1418) TaxID=582402 RepID=C6XJH7_HIRBI|nr:transglutaminase family protein [Hirschia baltica]ACT59272.1 transglutaminase domain protein [Hirschia baltica ATCC 49814]
MQYEISLNIAYKYDYPAAGGRHLLHMVPKSIEGCQNVEFNEIIIDPVPDEMVKSTDFFGNHTLHIAFQAPHKSLVFKAKSQITRESIVVPADTSPLLNQMKAILKEIRSLSPDSPHHFIGPSQRITSTECVQNYTLDQITADMSVFTIVKTINQAINRDMTFDSRATQVDTPYEQSFANRHGVCQDFSHIMIACLRSLNIPAAYVSGYLRTIPPEGKERLEGADAMHAWVRAWLGPDMGWLEFDPTNNIIVNEDHIVIGYGRDYSDISPIKGVLRAEGSQTSYQSVDVKPL